MKLPRLTLRDLFWLLLVVAMGCAWWVSLRRAHAQVALAEEQALAAERAVVLCQYHFWDIGRAWAKEVNRDLTIEVPPNDVLHVEPSGGVRHWSHRGEHPPPDVEYSGPDYSPIGQRQLPDAAGDY
jgi:hypothetical protein